jgi:hypothetical protein
MARVIEDTTKEELENPPETNWEASQLFYTPSTRYRKVLNILDKDLTLANLGRYERRELLLICRIMLNAIKLEDVRAGEANTKIINREISDYWIQRASLAVTSSRAKEGFTALLTKTDIKKEQVNKDEVVKDNTPRGFLAGFKPGA